MKVGFIGVGNMGGALCSAVSKTLGGESIYVCDANEARAMDISKKYGACCSDALKICEICDYIFIGVKPQMIRKLLENIKPVINNRQDDFALVSMAAGVSIDTIGQMCGGERHCHAIIRIMPSISVSAESGMILCAINDKVTKKFKDGFEYMMQKAGKLDFIKEEQIDAASALTGCGPAFVAMFVEALADGAVSCGISREKALEYANMTVMGAAKYLTEIGKHPALLKDAVCSPAGSTIEGVLTLEDGAFRALVSNAVKASYEKTKELGKQ